MDEIRFFLLYRFPAEIHDRPEAQGLVVLLPTIPNQDGIRVRERNELELCSRRCHRVRLTRDGTKGDDLGGGIVILTRNRSELVRLEDFPRNSLLIGIFLPFHVSRNNVRQKVRNGGQSTVTPTQTNLAFRLQRAGVGVPRCKTVRSS